MSNEGTIKKNEVNRKLFAASGDHQLWNQVENVNQFLYIFLRI